MISVRILVVYLAEGFPGVPVGSAQAHHHVHSKPPHHVVLQIPVRRGMMYKKRFLLTQKDEISVMGCCFHCMLYASTPTNTHSTHTVQAIVHKHI